MKATENNPKICHNAKHICTLTTKKRHCFDFIPTQDMKETDNIIVTHWINTNKDIIKDGLNWALCFFRYYKKMQKSDIDDISKYHTHYFTLKVENEKQAKEIYSDILTKNEFKEYLKGYGEINEKYMHLIFNQKKQKVSQKG